MSDVTSSPIWWRHDLAQVADYPPAATFGPRRLEDYEFVWILRGSARWTIHEGLPGESQSDRTEHRLRPGTLALSRAGTVDSYHWDANRPSTHAYVHFDLEPQQAPLGPDWPATRSLAENPALDGLCGYLLQLSGMPGEPARRRSHQMVSVLLDLFVRGPVATPEPLPAALVAVTDHVRTAWDRDGMRIVSVDELSEACHLSSGHVFRLFRRAYGCGPARALELVRLSRAAVSLQRSNATIGEIAHRCGFADAYHFSRRFSGAYTTAPGRFRAQQPPLDPLLPIKEVGLLPLSRCLR
jgi:AraC-like DNA-binding protein